MGGPPGEADETLPARLLAERHRTDALIRDLKHELAAIADSTAAGPDDEHDCEGSTVAYERARVQALLAHAQHGAAEIEAAARRPAGIRRCRRCQAPLPAERLLALPTTEICVDCAARP